MGPVFLATPYLTRHGQLPTYLVAPGGMERHHRYKWRRVGGTSKHVRRYDGTGQHDYNRMAPSTLQLGIPPENIKGRTDFKPGPSLHISGYDSAIGGVKAAGVMGARVDCSESPPTISAGASKNLGRSRGQMNR